MDIKQLRFLDALAQEKHFGRAAAACFITQPTLSLRIRQLENELGIPLIQRGNRFEGLTPEGERVLAWARRVLSNYEGLQQEISLIRDDLHGTLKLGIIPSALPFSAQLTTPFLQKYPRVAVISRSDSADEINQALESFALDLGISYLSRQLPKNLQTQALYCESYVALVPKAMYEQRFRERDELTWLEAAELPLCLLTGDMHNRWIIEDTLEKLGCSVQPQLQSSSLMTLYAHVMSGHWATIVPSFHAQSVAIPASVKILALHAPYVEHPVGLIWREAEPLSPLVAAFCAMAIQVSA
ncbi:MAG: LysR family transcriptional regulator [Proteobacteria bacterium]|nr:MAG: LysR family transcriptional regulator [Pseudomonadota bacterium]